MLVKAEDFDRFINRQHGPVFIYLFHGTDPGLIHERAKSAVKKSIADIVDAFQLVRFSGDEIASKPGLLADETATIGLFGDSRAIWIEVGAKSIIEALEQQIANPPSACKIILQAGNLKPASPLRKLLDGSKLSASVGCYPDGPAELGRLVEATLRAQNLTIAPHVRDYLVSILGNDRLITRTELDKLCLYAMGQGEVSLSHIAEIMNDAAPSALDEAIDAAFSGERFKIEILCERVFRDGVDAAYLLSTALGHAMRLHRIRLEIDSGGQTDQIMNRSGLFYLRKQTVQSYISRWTTAKIQSSIETLQEAVVRTRIYNNLGTNLSTRALWKISSMTPAPTRR